MVSRLARIPFAVLRVLVFGARQQTGRSMSWKLLNWAWKADCKTPAAKLVLVSLANAANDAGKSWQSAPTIAKRCCLSIRHVLRQISGLQRSGLISVEHRDGMVSLYSLTPNLTPATPDTMSGVTHDIHARNPGHLRHQPLTPCHATPDTMSPDPSISTKNHPIQTPADGLSAMEDGRTNTKAGSDIQQYRKPENLSEEALYPNGVPIPASRSFPDSELVASLGLSKRAAYGPTRNDLRAFAITDRIPVAVADKFFELNERNGWRFPKNGKPIGNPQAALHNFYYKRKR